MATNEELFNILNNLDYLEYKCYKKIKQAGLKILTARLILEDRGHSFVIYREPDSYVIQISQSYTQIEIAPGVYITNDNLLNKTKMHIVDSPR